MTFIDNLKNIQPLEFNESVLGNSTEIVSNSLLNANTSTDNLWFVIVIWIVFIWLNWIVFDKDKGIVLDIMRSMLISSAWCLIISVVAVLTGFTNSINPVIWFSSILFIAGVAVMARKEKGL